MQGAQRTSCNRRARIKLTCSNPGSDSHATSFSLTLIPTSPRTKTEDLRANGNAVDEESASFSEEKAKIIWHVEQDYNPEYPHSALGYRSPVEFVALLAHQAQAA